MTEDNLVEWETPEYEYREKSSDWFFAVGIIGLALALVALIFANILLSILIGLATFVLIMYSRRVPEIIRVGISTKGVRVGKEFFPYNSLDSFWVEEEEDGTVFLSLLSKERTLRQHITLYVPQEIAADDLKDLMIEFLDEEYHEPSLMEAIAGRLGF